MAKIKTKKKNVSDIKMDKLKRKNKSLNPFEVQVNRQKFHVLGRKMKQDHGLPGIARAKSIKKRKETLLLEYKVKDKANTFLDRRIGEKNSSMTHEDRILARFTAERLRAHKRKAIFNLSEDQVLTHKGRSLAEIDNFENPSSDEEHDMHQGKLDASFVEEAHFGGGLLKKADESKGRAAIIDQLIAESKKRKAEKQEAKEKTMEKTNQLDSEWHELMPMVASSGTGAAAVEPVEKKDAYDVLMNELKFEARGTPSNRLKSESELAAEEARKLQELEEERLRRMRGEEAKGSATIKHRSADDLDDGFEIEEQEDEEFRLLYDKEGNLITKTNDIKEKKTVKFDLGDIERNDESDEEECDDGDDKESEDGNDDDQEENSDSDDENIYDLSDMKNVEENIEVSEEECEPEVEVVIDKKSCDNESAVSDVIKEKKSKRVAFDNVVKTIEPVSRESEELVEDEQGKQELMDQARQMLPFTFSIPETYDELFELMEDKSMDEQALIIKRMIKCNHPSLNEKNKVEMNKLFAFLLQLLNDSEHVTCWNLLNHLAPFLFELTQFSPSNAAHCITEVLKEKHEEFLEKKHKYPPAEVLVFLELIPVLFPTSDNRHPVTTPAMVFITEMLRHCKVTTRRAIASGLLLVTLITQYVNLSKRILPEALNYLCGLIYMATPTTNKALIVPPFQQEHKFLFLQNTCADFNSEKLQMLATDLAPKSVKIDDSFRIRIIYVAVNLLELLIDLWKDIPGIWLLLAPVMEHIAALEVDKYPSVIGKAVSNLQNTLTQIKNIGFAPIVKEETKPKALRLYDPKIQPVYENRRKRKNDEKSEQSKLLFKYKREMKGALREIRRDRSFLANIKFKEINKSDTERMKKVKEIYSWGRQQQADLNKMDRQKKRRK